MSAKSVAARVHRVVAPLLAVFLIVAAGTGLVLNFEHPLMERAFPAPACDGAVSDVGRDLESIRAAHAGFEDLRVVLPEAGSCGLYVVQATMAGDWTPSVSAVVPGSGQRVTDTTGLAALVEVAGWLHVTLLAGKVGETLVGLVGLLLASLALTGLVQWWPGWSRLGQALRLSPGGGTRRWSELHRLMGSVAAVLVLVSSTTGALMALNPVAESVTRIFSPVKEWDRNLNSGPGSLSAAIATAERELPRSRAVKLVFSPDGRQPHRLILERTDSPLIKMSDVVAIDPDGNRVKAVHDSRADTAGRRFLRSLFSVHMGFIWGAAGTTVVAVTGVMLLALTLTGLVIWASRRKFRQQTRERLAAKSRVGTTAP